jgi:hypothetical protein
MSERKNIGKRILLFRIRLSRGGLSCRGDGNSVFPVEFDVIHRGVGGLNELDA